MLKACLVTTTCYGSPEEMRFKLACKLVRKAQEIGLPIFVVDGSPDAREISFRLRVAGATVFRQQTDGMGPARSEVLRHAIEQDYEAIGWVEPEKHTLIQHIPTLMGPVITDQCDMVIPQRISLETYPAYQRDSELEANRELASITGRPDLDLMSGPRFMNRKAAEIMAAYDGEYGNNWEILFVPVLHMLKAGLRITSVPVPYEHPEEQRAEDDEAMRRKRDIQREVLVAAMKKAAAAINY